jgi:large subunit ribosomal protein L21
VKEVALFAIILTGGKQYRVSPGDILRVERLPGERGDEVSLKEVLLVADDDSIQVGRPMLAGAEVKGAILRQGKAKKIIVFKKKRRKKYRRKQGHRQLFTALQVKEILV